MLLFVPKDAVVEETANPGLRVVPLPGVSSAVDWFADSEIRPPLSGCSPDELVAMTASVDAAGLRCLTDSVDRSFEGIVLRDNPLPEELAASYSDEFRSLLIRPVPEDLCAARALHWTANQRSPSPPDRTDCVHRRLALSAWQRQATRMARMATGACVNPRRLPAPGPGRPECSETSIRQLADQHARAMQCTAEQRTTLSAGILLLHDHLDASHALSQTLEGRGNPRTGDYWHGIMHRREPDAGNAAYWFRRVGRHPAMDRLSSRIPDWLRELGCSPAVIKLAGSLIATPGRFDPFALNDLAQIALGSPGSGEEETVRIVQYLEMVNLLTWSLPERP